MKIDITAAEASLLLSLLFDNEERGWYYGNQRQWTQLRQRLIEKINAAVYS